MNAYTFSNGKRNITFYKLMILKLTNEIIFISNKSNSMMKTSVLLLIL